MHYLCWHVQCYLGSSALSAHFPGDTLVLFEQQAITHHCKYSDYLNDNTRSWKLFLYEKKNEYFALFLFSIERKIFFTRYKRAVLIEISAWVKCSLSPWCLLTNINAGYWTLVLLSTSCVLSADLTSLVWRCVKLSAKMTVPAFSALAFTFNQNMNHEDLLKEMHNKVHTCTLPNKVTMEAMMCITMTLLSSFHFSSHPLFKGERRVPLGPTLI